jgi:hypothetical protein
VDVSMYIDINSTTCMSERILSIIEIIVDI